MNDLTANMSKGYDNRKDFFSRFTGKYTPFMPVFAPLVGK
jgi:hypothetical protein